MAAGRQGEDAVRARLEELGGEVRSAVRLNSPQGRREIDLVLRTRSHVYLFVRDRPKFNPQGSSLVQIVFEFSPKVYLM